MDTQFKLEIKVIPKLKLRSPSISEQILIDFVLAVTGTKSCIEIVHISGKLLLQITSSTPESIYKQFCEKVTWIENYNNINLVTRKSESISNLITRNLFPNLKRLDDFRYDGDDKYLVSEGLPKGLKWLVTGHKEFSPGWLPKSLTCLELTNENWTIPELYDALFVIGQTCCLLSKLKIVWRDGRPAKSQDYKRAQICSLPSKFKDSEILI